MKSNQPTKNKKNNRNEEKKKGSPQGDDRYKKYMVKSVIEFSAYPLSHDMRSNYGSPK